MAVIGSPELTPLKDGFYFSFHQGVQPPSTPELQGAGGAASLVAGGPTLTTGCTGLQVTSSRSPDLT